tara:strand:- start:1635 stop:2333 length:699 start_codon:yes stop_codon:yes gene_type:complete
MANVKLNTKITSFTDVQKSLQSIEKHLNELSSSVNASAETEVSDKDGKTGDIKTTRNVDGTYTFEIRTEEGWKTPSFGENLIKFKDKSASYSQNKVQSIEDIEAEDTTSGDTKANKNIFDEKNDTFSVAHLTGLPRPDYDSGWIDLVQTDTGGTHALGVLPILTMTYFSTDSGVTDIQYGVPMQSNVHSALNLTTTTWELRGNDYYGYWADSADNFTAMDYAGYQFKVLLWK